MNDELDHGLFREVRRYLCKNDMTDVRIRVGDDDQPKMGGICEQGYSRALEGRTLTSVCEEPSSMHHSLGD